MGTMTVANSQGHCEGRDGAHISAEWPAAADDISRAVMTPWKAVPPEQTRSTSCTWAAASFLLKICHELFLSISFPNSHATTQNMTISCLPKPTHSSDSEDKPIPTMLCRPLTPCLCLLFSLSFLTWSNQRDFYSKPYKNTPKTSLAPRLKPFCAISLRRKIVIQMDCKPLKIIHVWGGNNNPEHRALE